MSAFKENNNKVKVDPFILNKHLVLFNRLCNFWSTIKLMELLLFEF